MKKKVSISVYLVFGGISLFFIGLIFLVLYSQWFSNPERAFFERSFDHAWILIVSLLVVITGTIGGVWIGGEPEFTRVNRRQTLHRYLNQKHRRPAVKLHFGVGFFSLRDAQ